MLFWVNAAPMSTGSTDSTSSALEPLLSPSAAVEKTHSSSTRRAVSACKEAEGQQKLEIVVTKAAGGCRRQLAGRLLATSPTVGSQGSACASWRRPASTADGQGQATTAGWSEQPDRLTQGCKACFCPITAHATADRRCKRSPASPMLEAAMRATAASPTRLTPDSLSMERTVLKK